MATITPTIDYRPSGQHNAALATWANMTQTGTDVGAPFEGVDFGDATVQVQGTLGAGGTLQWQGSNNGTNWVVLTDPQGNALTFTAIDRIEVVAEKPRYSRPAVTGGDGTTSLTVTMYARRSR